MECGAAADMFANVNSYSSNECVKQMWMLCSC